MLPSAFHDLPPESFPITFRILDAATREELWTATVEGPGALTVPERKALGDRDAISSISFGTGEEWETGSDRTPRRIK